MKLHTLVALCMAVVVLGGGPAVARLGPSFSLDDNPQNPLTSLPGFIPGFGAEDPFGLGTYGPPLAPSPTLISPPAMDADILKPDPSGVAIPIIDVGMSPLWNGRFGYVDAISDNTLPGGNVSPVLHLGFSVDRISRGTPGTDVDWQTMLNQQPGDVFRTNQTYRHPVQFLGWPGPGFGYGGPLPTGAAIVATNHLLFDESRLCLTAGNGVGNPIGPMQPCPPIQPRTHDNVDAVNWQQLDEFSPELWTDRILFFSVAPDEQALSGFRPADIIAIPPNTPPAAAYVYAAAGMMGLMDEDLHYQDNIDGLVVWDGKDGEPGYVDPGRDYALFSLSHGSVSLMMYASQGLTEADIFFTDFTGMFWLYAPAQSMGLENDPHGSDEKKDNVDALEAIVPGDADLDGDVDLDDFAILKNNFGNPATWTGGDFDGNGMVDLDDFVILKLYFGTTVAK